MYSGRISHHGPWGFFNLSFPCTLKYLTLFPPHFFSFPLSSFFMTFGHHNVSLLSFFYLIHPLLSLPPPRWQISHTDEMEMQTNIYFAVPNIYHQLQGFSEPTRREGRLRMTDCRLPRTPRHKELFLSLNAARNRAVESRNQLRYSDLG